jgi:hypothetical protein
MGDQLDRDRHADKGRAGSAMTLSTLKIAVRFRQGS